MNSPKAPTPPDPVATAQAQGQINKDTAISQSQLNMVDQYGPNGSSVYNQTGTYSDGTPKFSQTVNLSPTQQALYDSQNSIQQSALNLGQNAVGNVQNAISQPFDTSGVPGQVFGVSGGQPLQYGVGNYGSYQGSVPGQTYQTSLGDSYKTSVPGQNYQTSFDGAGPIQQSITGSKDYGANVQAVQDALMSRLDPTIQQDRTRLDTKLANQGITQGSDAYNRAITLNEQNVNDQRTQALLAAGQEQSRLAGLDLQAGNFANSAQQQSYNENLGQAQFANNAKGQQFATDLSGAQFGNGATLDAANFGNNARGQQYATDLSGAQFGNSVVSQQLSDLLSQAGLNNTTSGQAFNQNLTNANLQNSGRASAIQELAYNRSQPINELASLMGFSPGVQAPNFQSNPQSGIAPADYQGIVQNNYQGALDQYKVQQQAQSALLGDIFGLAGQGGAAAITKFSDRRLKTDIRRIGTADNGLPIYSYRMKDGGPFEIGFMADEVKQVKPWAVTTQPNGFDAVNYSMAAA